MGDTALDYALLDVTSTMFKYFLELHQHDIVGDEALGHALRVLRPPGKDRFRDEASHKLRISRRLFCTSVQN